MWPSVMALALGVLGLGAAYAAVAALRPLAVPDGWPPASDLAEYSAVLHVHSRYSHDGRREVEEVAAAAARAGVRVVFLTDHNTLAPLREGKEGWHGAALVLVGAEITTGSGYLLLLDPPPDALVQARGYAVADLVARYREAGALVFLAHPEHPRLRWRDELPALDGLEVVDVFDQVVGASWPRQILGLLAYPANPVMAILSVVHWPRQALAMWDRLQAHRPVVGALALDAHGGIALTEGSGLRFPAHETAFRLGQLHFVTQEPLRGDLTDRRRVYAALRAGRFYNAFDGLAPAAGFRFEVAGGGRRALMGESLAAGDLTAEIRVPPVGEGRLRLLRDGAVVHEAVAAPYVRVPVTAPGAYRVEVDLRINLFPVAPEGFAPWIFSNPIRIGS